MTSNRRPSRDHVGCCLLRLVSFSVFLLAPVLFAAAQAPSAPGKALPAGPMQAKVRATCTQCHNASRITERHMSREEWSKELEKMEGLGAVIPEADRNGMLSYLTRNFGSQKGNTKAAAKKTAD
jgi:hypothetical protein